MVVVASYTVAVLMCVITMLCWGSWANTQKLASKLTVTATCVNEPCTAKTTVSIKVPKVGRKRAQTIKPTAVTKQLVGGRGTKVDIALSRSQRAAISAALLARKKVVATVTIVFTDAAGNRSTVTKKITLKR